MVADLLYQSGSSVPILTDPFKPNESLLLPPFGAACLATRTSNQQQFTRDCLYFAGGRIWAMDWLQDSAAPPGLQISTMLPQSVERGLWQPSDGHFQMLRGQRALKGQSNTWQCASDPDSDIFYFLTCICLGV